VKNRSSIDDAERKVRWFVITLSGAMKGVPMLFQERYYDGQSTAVINSTGVLHIHEHFKNYKLFPWHCHAFYELQFYFNPLDSAQSSDRVLLFFAPFQPHTCNDVGYRYTLLVQFSPKFIKRCVPSFPDKAVLSTGLDGINEAGIRIPKGSPIDCLLTEISNIVPSYRDGEDIGNFNRTSAACYNPEYEMHLNSTLLHALALLLKNKTIVMSQEAAIHTDSKLYDLITFIIEKPYEQMSMHEAAELAHMSYSDFSRRFKATIGYGYADFRNMSRISLAEEILRFEDADSTEIAQRLNFGSTSYFNRIFRRFTGVTPGEYKARSRNDVRECF
jgi:AraC-type DNA-binding domain-containing proteins